MLISSSHYDTAGDTVGIATDEGAGTRWFDDLPKSYRPVRGRVVSNNARWLQDAVTHAFPAPVRKSGALHGGITGNTGIFMVGVGAETLFIPFLT